MGSDGVEKNHIKLTCGLASGAVAYDSQKKHILSKECHVLVATPGRLLDFMDKGVVSLERVVIAAFDNADMFLLPINESNWGGLYKDGSIFDQLPNDCLKLYMTTVSNLPGHFSSDRLVPRESFRIVPAQHAILRIDSEIVEYHHSTSLRRGQKYKSPSDQNLYQCYDYVLKQTQFAVNRKFLVFCNTKKDVDLFYGMLLNQGVVHLPITRDKKGVYRQSNEKHCYHPC